MKIEIETKPYNERRYGRPWIAKVDFSTNPKGDYEFGSFVGNEGDAGLLVKEFQPGDIGCKGQKDNRAKFSKNDTVFFSINADGTLEFLQSKATAYKRFFSNKEGA